MYEKVNVHLKQIEKEIELIRELYHPEPPPPDTHLVKQGENLQAALDSYDRVALESHATFEGTYTIKRPNSLLLANNGLIVGKTGPALIIPTFQHHIEIKDLTARTEHNNVVILSGYNTTGQSALDSVPHHIRFENCLIPSYRGKRGFEINSRATSLVNCSVIDLYDPGARDSQGIAILNSPGDIHIVGGRYEAASENILVGGDSMKIPFTRPTDILIENLEVFKPLHWKNEIPNIKNLIELKDGHNVTIKNVVGRNSWKSGQDGWAFVFTPTRGGSLQNVQVIDCDMENVGGIVQILGVDIDGINNVRSQISFQGGRYRTNKAAMGGRGLFALVTGGPDYLHIHDVDVVHDGTQFVYIGDLRPVNSLVIGDCIWNTGQYGITISDAHQANNSAGQITEMHVEDNNITINGMSSTQARNFRNNVPNNTFL